MFLEAHLDNIYDMDGIKIQDFLNKKFDYNIVALDHKKFYKSRDYIDTECKLHGKSKIRYDHLLDYGCSKCLNKSSLDKRTFNFVKNANFIHKNLYTYDKVDYTDNKTPVIISCKKHGDFKQRPDNHLAGAGCKYCNYILSNSDFIDRCRKIHGNKFNYDRVKYKTYKEYVEIGCQNHGYFNQLARVHLDGFGCPICSQSVGENKIKKYLEENEIEFKTQFKFKDCRDKYQLSFDFYLPKYNLCIEYDGVQHSLPVKYFGGEASLQLQIRRDKIKTNFCKENNIKLIRISYLDNIESKLMDIFR